MDGEMLIAFGIVTLVALVMLIIGCSQYRTKDNPVGFYNVTMPPSKEEISDIKAWNKKHGIIWIVYAACIEIGFLLGLVMPFEILEMVVMFCGIVLPLPFMVIRHKSLEKEYMRK